MTFIDTFGGTGSPFGNSGIAAGNPGPPGATVPGSGGFGSSSSKAGGPGPGFVSPFDQQAVGRAAQFSGEAMANRYAQLGLSGQGATPTSPGGPAGGIGVGSIGAGIIPGGGLGGPGSPSETTAEMQDLGQIPTLTGGIPGEAMATIGEIQNANLANQSSSGGGGGGKGGGGKGAGQAIGAIAPLALGGK
jgi:hypothetical protein